MMWIITTILLTLLSLVLFIENRYLKNELESQQYALMLLMEDKLNRESDSASGDNKGNYLSSDD